MDRISSTGYKSPLELSSDESSLMVDARYLELSVTTHPPTPALPSLDLPELPGTSSVLSSRGITSISELPPYLMEGDEPSESDWKEGVDMTDPPFATRAEFIDYCKNQLSSERQKELTGLINDDATAKANNLNDCKKNIKDALMTFALFKLHEDDSVTPGVAISRACNRMKGKHPRMQASDFIARFIPNNSKVWCAYSCQFDGFRTELKEQASELDQKGETTAASRNATYWLIKLLDHDGVKTNHAVGFLNRNPKIPCPFGKKWDFINAWKMIRDITVEELLDNLASTSENDTRPSQQLFRLANNGNEEALAGYIHYYHKKRKHRNNEIAGQLRGHVKIPEHGVNTNWQAHMVHQYICGDPITIQPPLDYKEVVDEAKRKTRRHGLTRIRKKSVKTKSEKGKGRAKLQRDSSSSESELFDAPPRPDWQAGHFYSMRTRPVKGPFGEPAELSDSPISSESEEEFFAEPVRKQKESRPSSKKKMKIDPKTITARRLSRPLPCPEPIPEPMPQAQPSASGLDYSSLDLKLLRQLAEEKDPMAIAEYIRQITPFLTCEEEIIPLLNSEHIRPQKGRWNAAKLDYYRTLNISK